LWTASKYFREPFGSAFIVFSPGFQLAGADFAVLLDELERVEDADRFVHAPPSGKSTVERTISPRRPRTCA
jgi:hypothetical protein